MLARVNQTTRSYRPSYGHAQAGSTGKLASVAKRGIYFIRPERETEVTDFALNLGYNDLYSAYSGQYMNTQGKLKLRLRRKQLELMFRTHYYLLLKAITTQNYEQLEVLTENNLTVAIAA